MVKYHRSESFIHFTYFKAISLVKTKKNRGVVYLPPGKNQNRVQFVFLSFGVAPLNWQSFTEIGEIACSTTAWCSRGHVLKSQNIMSNPPYCLPYNLCDVSLENLELDQPIIPQLIFFLILVTCLLFIILIMKGEILSRSPVGLNPLSPKILLVVFLSICYTVLVMLVWRI